MNPWVIVAALAATFGGGFYLGGLRGSLELAKAHVAADAAVQTRLNNTIEELGRYEQQLRAAHAQHVADLDAIDAAAHRPGAGVVCHTTAPRPGAVPADPAQADAHAPGAGGAGELPRQYDPRPGVLAIASLYAKALSQCYADLDTWP